MSLRESIEEVRFIKENEPCPFSKIINQLNKEDKEALQDALDKRLPDVTIANALRKEGFRIAEISISKHRRALCRCITNK